MRKGTVLPSGGPNPVVKSRASKGVYPPYRSDGRVKRVKPVKPVKPVIPGKEKHAPPGSHMQAVDPFLCTGYYSDDLDY